MAKLPKTLDLGWSNLGGRTGVYARNIIAGGDWATIALITGDKEGNSELFIEQCKGYATPEYLEQIKAFILSVRPETTFANDQSTGQFVDIEAVITKAQELSGLMPFEVNMIRNNPDKLHEVYSHVKTGKYESMPSFYNYEFNNGLYPIYQVFNAVNTLVNAQ